MIGATVRMGITGCRFVLAACVSGTTFLIDPILLALTGKAGCCRTINLVAPASLTD
jgi:hypothetical protein